MNSETIATTTANSIINNDVKMTHESTINVNLVEKEKKQTTSAALAQEQNDLML